MTGSFAFHVGRVYIDSNPILVSVMTVSIEKKHTFAHLLYIKMSYGFQFMTGFPG